MAAMAPSPESPPPRPVPLCRARSALLELFGELHPLHFEGFGFIRNRLQLLVELAQAP